MPALMFVNPIAPSSTIGDAEFYVIQRLLPVQMGWQEPLGSTTIVFLATCAPAVPMTQIVSLPSMGQTLRLHADSPLFPALQLLPHTKFYQRL